MKHLFICYITVHLYCYCYGLFFVITDCFNFEKETGVKFFSYLFECGLQVEGIFDDAQHTQIHGAFKKVWQLLIDTTEDGRVYSDSTLLTANRRIAVFPYVRWQNRIRFLATKIPKKNADKLTAMFP